MKKVSFLIGAGFSYPAGYPIGDGLNEKILNVKADDLGIHPDGTVYLLNGEEDPIRGSSFIKRMFFERFISFYTNSIISGQKFDYEKFYDFYRQLDRKELKSKPFNEFVINFKDEFKHYEDTKRNLLSGFNDILNQLLSIYLVKPDDSDDSQYKEFFNFLNTEYDTRFYVHTLNHDCLFESLSESYLNKELSSGFNLTNTPFFEKLRDESERPLAEFKGEYETDIHLYKLHGSIDHVPFISHYNAKKCIKIFSDTVFTEIFSRIYIDGKERIENCWINYFPDFLSGTTEKISSTIKSIITNE